MNTIKKIVLILGCFIVCSCRQNIKDQCEISEVKLLFTDVSIYENKVDGYVHYILVKDLSKQCLDSTKMVNMAYAYLDTVTKDKPVNVLKFYFSDKDFILNEKSQDLTKINKSALFSLILDKNFKINEFIFYNDEGNIHYWGQKWKSE